MCVSRVWCTVEYTHCSLHLHWFSPAPTDFLIDIINAHLTIIITVWLKYLCMKHSQGSEAAIYNKTKIVMAVMKCLYIPEVEKKIIKKVYMKSMRHCRQEKRK